MGRVLVSFAQTYARGMPPRNHAATLCRSVGVPEQIDSGYIRVYVSEMTHLSIRDLQKISGESIAALDGPTAIKSGDRTVALLLPLKAANVDRLKKALEEAERLARLRPKSETDAFVETYGDGDLTDWTIKDIRASRKER